MKIFDREEHIMPLLVSKLVTLVSRDRFHPFSFITNKYTPNVQIMKIIFATWTFFHIFLINLGVDFYLLEDLRDWRIVMFRYCFVQHENFNRWGIFKCFCYEILLENFMLSNEKKRQIDFKKLKKKFNVACILRDVRWIID